MLIKKKHVEGGCYFRHLLSYVKQKHKENILFLTYEQMKEDTAGAIRKVAEFLGGQYLENVNKDGVLTKVLDNSSISFMKKVINPFVMRAFGSTKFIRKGVIGDYKTLFSQEQEKRLSDKFRQTCNDSEAIDLWRKYGIPIE